MKYKNLQRQLARVVATKYRSTVSQQLHVALREGKQKQMRIAPYKLTRE